MRNLPLYAVSIGLLLAGCGADKASLNANEEGPYILSMAPAPSQSFIPVDPVFVIEFSAPMDPASVEDRFQIRVAEKPVGGHYAWNNEGTVVSFQPVAAFASETELQVYIGPGMRSRQGRLLVDQSGQTLDAFSFGCLTYDDPQSFASNGERIYFSATSASGTPITFVIGPYADSSVRMGYWPNTRYDWTLDSAMMASGMMNGRMGGGGMSGLRGPIGFHGMTCASCHGPDGRGGRFLAMGTVQTPDIRYATLTDPAEHEGEHEHIAYTDALILQAVSEGIEPDGEALNPFMPRWSMADEDWHDLLDFLKTL